MNDNISIAKIQKKLAAEGVQVGTNWIRRAILKEGVVRSISVAQKLAMNVRRVSLTCQGCDASFSGKQVNEKYCLNCAPSPQARKRVYHYGLREPEFQKLLRDQDDSCAVCKISFDKLPVYKNRESSIVVDHAHESGVVRGLLCHECNITIGYIEKHPREMLDKILAYLTTGVSSCTDH